MAQVKKEQVRNAIVESAYMLFRKKSYLGTSVAEIARGAGVVPSAVYVYFDSKFEIFYAAYEPWLQERMARLERKLSKIENRRDRLFHMIKTFWIDLPADDNGFANNLMQAVSTADKNEPYRSDRLARTERALSEHLWRAIPAGTMTRLETERLAHILLMAYDGFIVRYHVGGFRGDMTEVVETMAKLIAGRVRRPAKQASRTKNVQRIKAGSAGR
jgi:AcrR family transcriptional regulator